MLNTIVKSTNKGLKYVQANYLPIIVILLIVIVFFYSKTSISNWFKARANVLPIPEPGTNEPPKNPNFNPSIIATELYEALSGIFVAAGTKEQAAKKFFELPRFQKIQVWNYWNLNFAADMKNETIFGAMDAEINTPSKSNYGIESYYERTLKYFENDSQMNHKKLK